MIKKSSCILRSRLEMWPMTNVLPQQHKKPSTREKAVEQKDLLNMDACIVVYMHRKAKLYMTSI